MLLIRNLKQQKPSTSIKDNKLILSEEKSTVSMHTVWRYITE